MIAVRCFDGRKVALFGLGGSGLSTAHALVAGGAEVAAWDDNEKSRASAHAPRESPLVDLARVDWRDFAALILTPGVPLTHPEAALDGRVGAQCRASRSSATSNCSAANARALAPRSPFVAITGTNGKSTTTALIAHILREAGRDCRRSAAISACRSSNSSRPSQDSIHVIECSSFQIDLAPSLDPSVGALLNITPDHLDRHGNLENYAAIKERLVAAGRCRAGRRRR